MTTHSGAYADVVFNDELLELPHEDFAAYCRLCFSISQLEPLFMSQQDENYQMIGMIELCTGIKLSPKTDSPSSICLQCRLVVDEFFNFRKLCQRLNRVYRRKRSEGVTTTTAAAAKVIDVVTPDYYQGGEDATTMLAGGGESAVLQEATQEVAPVVAIPGEPTPMEITDDTCATLVAPEPSALEASAVGDGTAPESFIVHELSDEDDGDVECTGITAMASVPIALDLNADNDDPFIKMANDWFCCKVCSRLYQSFVLLVEHIREKHPEKAEILRSRSKECYFKPPLEMVMIKHGASTLMKCDLCDTLLSGRSAIGRHRWRYHGAFDDCRKYNCKASGCSSFFMERKALNRHLMIIHGRKPRRQRESSKPKPVVASESEDITEVVDDDDDDDVVFITDEVSQAESAASSSQQQSDETQTAP